MTAARIASVALAVLLASACAPADTDPQGVAGNRGQPCFTADQIHNFRVSDGGSIYVRARVSEVFELSTPGCPSIEFSDALNIEPWGPSSQLCPGDEARMRPRGTGSVGVVCTVRIVRKLTPEQTAALPRGDRP